MIFSAYDENEYKKSALKAGAAGYLVKGDVAPDTIAATIENIARGERRGVRHYSPVQNLVADLKSPPTMQPV